MQNTPFAAFVAETWPDVDGPRAFEVELVAAYPGIDLLAEAKRARLWETTARAGKKNHRRFFVNWLRRSKATLLVRGGFSQTKTLGSGYQLALEDALKEAAARRGKAETLRTRTYLDRESTRERTSTPEALDRISQLLRSLDTKR